MFTPTTQQGYSYSTPVQTNITGLCSFRFHIDSKTVTDITSVTQSFEPTTIHNTNADIMGTDADGKPILITIVPDDYYILACGFIDSNTLLIPTGSTFANKIYMMIS